MQIEGKSDEKTDKNLRKITKAEYLLAYLQLLSDLAVSAVVKRNRNPDQSSIYPVLINQQN